jgi:hypothetical protein
LFNKEKRKREEKGKEGQRTGVQEQLIKAKF